MGTNLEIELDKANKRIAQLSMENEMLKISINESELLHKSVVENSLDGTIIFDIGGDILYANDEVFNITSYSVDELCKMSIDNIIDKNDLEMVKQIFSDVLTQLKDEVRFEFDIIDKNAVKVNAYASVSAVDEFQGERALICQVLNITHIKQAEEQMREMNVLLEKQVKERTSQLQEAMSELSDAKEEVTSALEQEKALNNLKSNFISIVSHEYRTPLTAVLTYTYILEQCYQAGKTSDFNNFLSKIRSAIESMTNLLNDVLVIGKANTNYTNLDLNKLDIINFMTDVLDECRAGFDTHDFKLSHNLSNNIIESDANHLRHIFVNLISNAAKYSPDEDTVLIEIGEFADNIEIKIIDFGIGIPEKEISHLFTTFHRASNVGHIQGTGLGLAIVKQSVDTLNGTIEVESVQDKGSLFAVTFPKSM